MVPSPKQPVRFQREEMIEHIAQEYRDAVRYTAELKRALDLFSHEFPPDSPFRYLRKGPGDAIVEYLTREGKKKTVKEITDELKAGSCIIGMMKPPAEVISKALAAYERKGLLMWLDAAKTEVGLTAWKKPAKKKAGS